ncbi:hypothetical protein HYX14_04015 [Candidatus Woesearchaeota archaeon]|nr:hypothetical protein [Candidatus Woesearchaeota archaeon]
MIVNKYDPVGLLKIGCPADEYDPEIKRIAPVLGIAANVKDFHQEVYLIFIDLFDKRTAGSKKIIKN